ncbi:MAG: hypothetical protein QM831_09685 [Kofleriaceae bacterium]
MKSIISAIAVLAAGCAVDEATTGTTSQDVTSQNKLAANKLAANKLAGNKLAGNKLAGNKLAGNKLAANSLGAGALASTPDGRDVLSYIVGCALDTSQVLAVFDDDGNEYDMPGWLGLATAWVDRDLTLDERHLVSSCLYSRTNYFGIAVHISLRGDSPLLATDDSEVAAYPFHEAAFWGDFFDPDNGTSWFTCESDQKMADEGNDAYHLRQCSTPSGNDDGLSKCGFTYTGVCGSQVPSMGIHVWLTPSGT